MSEEKQVSVLELAKKLNKEYDSDTFLRKSDIIPGYKRLNPMVFCGLYPVESSKFEDFV